MRNAGLDIICFSAARLQLDGVNLGFPPIQLALPE
jgi:hypothetical protein